MSQPSAVPDDRREDDEPLRRTPLPAWAVSCVLHAALLVALGAFLKVAPAGVGAGESLRRVEVVLKPRSELDTYVSETTVADQGQDTATQDGASTADAQSLFPASAPSNPADSLPKLPDTLGIGPAVPGSQGSLSAGQLATGPGPKRTVAGEKTRTSVFGLTGEGGKFVYVFDRSGSMGGSARSALKAAKDELRKSLRDLDRTHQFQIIFYNEAPTLFDLSGRGVGLVFGDDPSKALAEKFIAGITAQGATRHEEALMKAVRMGPDVIFFLTDADDPVLNAAQLDRISRANAGRAQIYCIEFGFGPGGGRENFLTQLSRMNGGQYVYVDISRFRGD